MLRYYSMYLTQHYFQILGMAFGSKHVPTRPHSTTGEIWHTSTTIQNLWTFDFCFLAETKDFGFVEWDTLGLLGI